jgi:hypothetical protein
LATNLKQVLDAKRCQEDKMPPRSSDDKLEDLISQFLINTAEGNNDKAQSVFTELEINVASYSKSIDKVSANKPNTESVRLMLCALTPPPPPPPQSLVDDLLLPVLRVAAGVTLVQVLRNLKGSPLLVSAGSIFVAAAAVFDSARNSAQAMKEIKVVEDAKGVIKEIEKMVKNCDETLTLAEYLIKDLTWGTYSRLDSVDQIQFLIAKIDGDIKQAELKFQAYLIEYEEMLDHKKKDIENKSSGSTVRSVIKGISGIALFGGATIVSGGLTAAVLATSGLTTVVAGGFDWKTRGDCQQALNDLEHLYITVEKIKKALKNTKARRDLLLKRLSML